jgi:hypothetical protein
VPERARLFEAVRDQLDEVTGHGFPFEADIVPRDRRAVAGRFALPTGRDDKEAWRNFYRAVDDALAEVSRDDMLPIVLAGVRTSTALFEDVTKHRDLVLGRLDGSHDQTGPHDLGREAWQVLRDRLRQRRREVIAELTDAVHTGKAVTGLDEVWRLGREGRGRLVVVEEDYRAEPAREVDGRLVPAGDDASGAGVVDDPVDDVIEHVVRAGGRAEFVEPDSMAELGRIGLLLR